MKQAWDIFNYELFQLGQLSKHIQASTQATQPLEIRNAVLESAVLHLRIILEMLKDKPAKSDDYCLSDLIDMKDKSADLDSLMNIYTDAGTYSPTVEALLGGDPTLILPNLKRSPK